MQFYTVGKVIVQFLNALFQCMGLLANSDMTSMGNHMG